jgi:hypothetical protein
VPELDLLLDAQLTDASVIRRLVEEHSQKVLADDDAADRLAMASHELLENAFKYSADGRVRLHLQFQRGLAGDHQVVVSVHNLAEECHALRLQAAIQEMTAFGNPKIYYRILLGRLTSQRGACGLGLARVSAEARLTLSVVRQAGQVTLRAETRVDRAQR